MYLKFELIFVGIALAVLTACAAPASTREAPDAGAMVKAEPVMTKKADHKEMDHKGASNHAPYGHASAQYVCDGRELLTQFTKEASILSYDGVEADVTLVSTAAGEVLTGTLDGRAVKFDAEAHRATFKIADQTLMCEKITCVPLGGPL